MRAVLVVALLLGLLPAFPSAADELPTTAPPAEAIRRVDLDRRLRVLVHEAFAGRETGTQGSRLAATYLAAEMASAGLEGGGEDGTFFQPYALGHPALGEANALEVTHAGVTVAARLHTDFNPFSMSPNRGASGPLAFVGYGITAKEKVWTTATGETIRGWDDYAGIDVRGKLVLVLRKSPGWKDLRHASFRAKVDNAARHGAAGLLLCNDPATTRGGRDEIRDWSAPSGMPTASAPIPCAFISQALAARLLGIDAEGLTLVEGALGALGPNGRDVEGPVIRLRTDVSRSTELDAQNVVGFLPGTDEALRDEVLVIGAHFDHLGTGRFGSLAGPAGRGKIHPGADDNGSGTVALLELAEYFATPAHRPRRSLVFVAFSGEELGLLGSLHYARHPLRPLDKTVAMVNLDMVGRLRENRVHVIGVGTAKGLDQVVRAANDDIGLDLRLNPQGAAGSDSLPFFRKRVPVLFFFTGMHDDYHRPTDTVATIDFDGLERVTKLVRGVIQRLADVATRPAFTNPPPRRRPPVWGIALGRERGGGVPLDAVTAGGAAAEAGLEVGDIVVAVAEREVRTAVDLRGVIRGMEAGKAVRVIVLRDGRRVEVSVVPRARAGTRAR